MINANRLTNAFVRKNLSLAWPIALNGLLMQSMLIIDTLLVSPLGELPLAGMGIASTLIAFVLGVQFALANGTQLVIGRAFGANSQRALSMALFSGLVINVLIAIVFLLALIILSEPLIAVLTQDVALAKQVATYLSISQYILIVTAFTQVFTAFFNGKGKSNIPLRGYLIELPFNALISYFLIFGWQIPENTLCCALISESINSQGMGLAGAALGSLAAVLLRVGYLFWQLSKLNVLNHFKLHCQPLMGECKRHFNEVYPIAANYIILAVGSTIYLLLFSQLDLYSYVAVTLIFPWIRIGAQLVNSWAQASAISISQAIGKQQTDQMEVIIRSSIAVGFIAAVIVSLGFYLLSLSIRYIYPQIENATYLALVSIAPLYIILPMVKTYNSIAGNILRALGKSITVLKIHFITQWFIVLPACSIMILYYGLPLYWAFSILVIEEILKAIPFYKTLKELRK